MRTLSRCLASVLHQVEVDLTVVVVDHGSTDGSRELVRGVAETRADVVPIELARTPTEPRSACRPLNAGIDAALGLTASDTTTWVYRLDADDVLRADSSIVNQLDRGRGAAMIMSTLVFFDLRERLAFVYGTAVTPVTRNRDVVSVAHHATAMRADLLRAVRSGQGTWYDERLRYGEDIDLTCKLLRNVDAAACRFTPQPLCYKQLSPETLTESTPIRDVALSYRLLRGLHPTLRRRHVARDLWETAMGRVVGATTARTLARGRLGMIGHSGWYPFAMVARRLEELGDRRALGGRYGSR